jgi:hypothetical protein
MISPSWNLLFEAHTHQITLNKQGFDSGSLGTYKRTRMGMKNKNGKGYL